MQRFLLLKVTLTALKTARHWDSAIFKQSIPAKPNYLNKTMLIFLKNAKKLFYNARAFTENQ